MPNLTPEAGVLLDGTLGTDERTTLYQQVASRIEALIDGGTLRPGDRIPSVRKLSGQLEVSISTVLEAYRLLEDRRLIEARPQSGYYVRHRADTPPEPERSTSLGRAIPLEPDELVLRVLNDSRNPALIPLGAAIPSAAFLPTSRLNRLLAQVAREDPRASQQYDSLAGFQDLRLQIARRMIEAGCSITPDDIITTGGTQEAVFLCLRAATKPGDTVAIETPTYYGLLEALESLHLRALEIATDPRDGICLDELEHALRTRSIAACAFVPNFGNPLGHRMPDEKKRGLVEMLARYEVPLVEDDIYADLCFEGERPRAAKAYDRRGLVMLCSSFSKTLAPGYRVGWTLPGRFKNRVARLKFSSAVATTTPTQMAIARYLSQGGFDRYLRKLRRTYKELTQCMSGAVAEAFPSGTRVSRPGGGHVLWIEMPGSVDSVRLYEDALEEGVSIAPGALFSATDRYRNFIRLNCAMPWNEQVADGVRRLGRLVERSM